MRIVKIKRSIKQAFLELWETMPLEKIRVTDICSIAATNKTTFYKHYRNIFTLSAEIENEAIALVMERFACFPTEQPKALDTNKEILHPLFHDNFNKLFIALHTLRSVKFERHCDDIILGEGVSQILAKMAELRSENRISTSIKTEDIR